MSATPCCSTRWWSSRYLSTVPSVDITLRSSSLVTPSRPFTPNPGEVRSVFEVPLDYLMREESYGTFRITRNGKEHTTWQIPHGGLVIWGITANLTRRFHDMALAGETA